ncbi:MAG: zinc ribbon domain-containing protein [Bacteroidetes bacterium]|nr:zinc ribbon domain-containing protein [Bacteroidota bacterium]
MKKFCKYCGSSIDADSIFCTSCGSRLENTTANTSKNDIATPEEAITKDLKEEEHSDQGKRAKYDYSYPRETSTASVGILLLVIHLVVILIVYLVPEIIHPIFWLVYKIYTIVLLRIIVLIWIGNIAQRLNRDERTWKIFGFIMPTIALIVIGYKRKLINENWVSNELLSKIEIEEIDDYYDEKQGKYTSYLVKLKSGESGLFYKRYSDKKYYISVNNKKIFFQDKNMCIEHLISAMKIQ